MACGAKGDNPGVDKAHATLRQKRTGKRRFARTVGAGNDDDGFFRVRHGSFAMSARVILNRPRDRLKVDVGGEQRFFTQTAAVGVDDFFAFKRRQGL